MYNVDPLSIERFEILDEMLRKENYNVELIIVGGELGKAILGTHQFRVTLDIDFIAEHDITVEVMRIINAAGLHDAGVIAETPPPEDITKAHSIQFDNLIVFYPSVEDFALTKLMSDRGKDEEDLMKYPILDKCDLKKVRDRIEEYKTYMAVNNPDYNYKKIDEYIKHRGL